MANEALRIGRPEVVEAAGGDHHSDKWTKPRMLEFRAIEMTSSKTNGTLKELE
jgi:hypothetical protein